MYYHIHKRRPLVPILSHNNSVCPPYPSPWGSILILSSLLRLCLTSFSFLPVPHQNPVCTCHRSHTCYMIHPSHSPWFDHPSYFKYQNNIHRYQGPRGLKRWSSAARLLRFGFEFHRGHGCLCVVSVVCCQVEVSATSWSLVQRSPTDCGASLCVI